MSIKAIGQPTKQGWVYTFNRETGQPIWPIEERPVEQGNVPGEWYSPTQPFVTKPPAFDRQGFSEADLIDFTPELNAEAKKIAANYKMGPIFTTPPVSTWPGPLGMLLSPVATGGANWQGGSLDPETNYMYIFANSGVQSLGMVKPDPTTVRHGLRVGHRARSERAASGRTRRRAVVAAAKVAAGSPCRGFRWPSRRTRPSRRST